MFTCLFVFDYTQTAEQIVMKLSDKMQAVAESNTLRFSSVLSVI